MALLLPAQAQSVRDRIPLEQGLRRYFFASLGLKFFCQRPYSIRTRIKTAADFDSMRKKLVRDHIPLEQGLRRLLAHQSDESGRSETTFH